MHCRESADVLVLAVPQCCAYYKYVCILVPMSPCLADKYHCDNDPHHTIAALCCSMRVRDCSYSAGGFSPVVSWAVHVSVGNEIQRETIKSKGERGMMSLDMAHIIFTELITDH